MDMQKNTSVYAKKRTAIVLIDADVASVKLHLVFCLCSIVARSNVLTGFP